MAVPNPFDKEALSTLLGGTAAFGTYGSIPPEAHLPFSQLPLNTKTHMSSLRGRHLASPPTIFPPRAAPPHNLPIRVAPNTEALAHLDALYHDKVCQGHKPVGVLDQTNGRDEPPRETRSEEALIALEKHMKDRLPYVQLASRRLQAVVGERNEMRFELPSASLRSGSIPMNPGFGGNVNLDAGGRASRAVARGSPGYAGASPSVTRKDDAMGLSVPRSPTGMFPAVDKKTGKGLREFLLQKGKEFGMRKRECKSISLHDFTPKGPTESFSNVLLGHYGADRGERVDVYEVDL
jgi:hypothetical protein